MEKIELNCPYEHQNNTTETELDNLAKDIRKLQDECNKYVLEQTPEQIKELLLTKNYFFVKDDKGEVVATIYKLPLLDETSNEKQIYRLGGLAIKNFEKSSLKIKKLLLQLIQKVKEDIENNNTQIIAESENPVILKQLIKNGGKELTYDEFEKNYPKFFKAYMSKIPNPAIETEEFLREQKFYIRVKK